MYSILQKGITVQMAFPFLHPSHLSPSSFVFPFLPSFFLPLFFFLPSSLSLSFLYLFICDVDLLKKLVIFGCAWSFVVAPAFFLVVVSEDYERGLV